jgi:uncharacterized repeat protein (TIGR01451 family)
MKLPTFQSGISNPRVLVAFALCSAGLLLAMISFATMPPSGEKGSAANSVATTLPGFHAPVTMPQSSGGSEPSLAISNNGVRYVSWQVPGEFASSSDGVNFTHRTTPASNAGGDVNNQVSYSGALYNIQICGGVTMLHSCLYRSLDGGQTWTTQNTLADMHPGASDRPWIDVYPKGNTTSTANDPNHDTIYLEYHTFSPDDLVYVTKSTDGGATFGPPIPVEQGTNATDSICNTLPGNILIDQSNGNVYALWISGDDVVVNETTGCNYSEIGPFPKAWVSKSTDGGTTWTPVLAWQGAFDPLTNIGDNSSEGFATISQDSSGQIHVGLSVRHNDDPRAFFLACQTDDNCRETPNTTDMLLLTSPDQGAHWTLPFKINQTNGSFFFPWIAAGSAGVVNAAYYSSTTLQPNNPTSIWFVGMSQVIGAVATYTGGPNATYVSTPVATPEILLDPNRVHGDGTTGGGICTLGLSCAVVPGSNRSLADVFEGHLDPAGGGNITWTSDNGGNHIGFACQNSGASAFAGAPDLNGCYGPTDMSVTKTDSPDPVAPGGTLTYHLTVTNNGTPAMPATTSGVTLTDILPAGVTFVSVTPSTGTCSGTRTVVCNLGIFPSGAAATVDIVVTAPNTSGTITNTASVSAATTDPTPGNNTATAMTTVIHTDPPPPAVVSRMTHGSAGDFDIVLPQPPATRGVECRSSALLGAGNYTLVFTFPNNLTSVASAAVTGHDPASGIGTVSTRGIGPNPNQYTVNLTSVSTGQYITVTLNNVLDVAGNTGNQTVQMGVLVGDVNSNGVVSNTDVASVKVQVAALVTPLNFRNDVNANGVISNTDVSLTKVQVGTSVP